MPANCVHAVMTSPPYWALRRYPIEDSIWGGDAACEHEWGSPIPRRGPAQEQGATSQRAGRANTSEQSRRADVLGCFCTKCGAWRGQLGLEPSVQLYVQHVVEIMREVRRVLRKDGVLWLNIGDGYASTGGHSDTKCEERRGAYRIGTRPESESRDFRALSGSGIKSKDLIGVPWRVALALQDDGWYLRSNVIWQKPNCMPESARDRPTRDYEDVFMFTKSRRYYYDWFAVQEEARTKVMPPIAGHAHGEGSHSPLDHNTGDRKGAGQFAGRTNMLISKRHLRTVWAICTTPYKEAHFATFPRELVRKCVLASTSEKGCCFKCGAPYRRLTEKSGMLQQCTAPGTIKAHREASGKHGSTSVLETGYKADYASVGWTPSCKCPDPDECALRPAIVLDPFGGAGTVGVECKALNRNAMLIERSPEYARMGTERIAKFDPKSQKRPKKLPPIPGQGQLFKEPA